MVRRAERRTETGGLAMIRREKSSAKKTGNVFTVTCAFEFVLVRHGVLWI